MADNHNNGVIYMEHFILAFKELTYIEWGLAVSLFMNIRLLYKYAQLDKIVLLIADRSHRDMIEIDTLTGDYKQRHPLNKPRVEK